MAINKIEEKGIALEDFIKEFSEAPFELFDGERVYWIPNLAGHTDILQRLRALIDNLPNFELNLKALFV